MRTIIRYSTDGDEAHTLGNTLRGILEDAGFVRTGTSCFEHQTIAPEDLAAVMCRFWNTISDPADEAGAAIGAALDHIWIYSDMPST
jgi:hypothetical protein